MSQNPLLEIASKGLPHPLHKWTHYFKFYDKHFSKFRNSKINILEIGIWNGGSIDLWNKYFTDCTIYGLDIDPSCKRFEKDNVKIFIGDQGDRNFLESLKTQLPEMSIIIDDGGHTMQQQLTTFEVLFPLIKPGGVFLCEDTHTSYWPGYQGDFRKQGTFVEFSKNSIDNLHFHHHNKTENDYFTKHCEGIHCYDSMFFFDKAEAELEPPVSKIW